MNLALQVWLPLNGNTKNCGLAGNDYTVSGSVTYANGISGKALNTGAIAMSANMTSKVLNNKCFIYCCWIYVNAETGSENRAMIFGTDSMPANNNRKFSIFQYPTCNDLHLSWMNDTANTTFLGTVLTGVLPSKQWTHIIVEYNNPTCNVYINGQLKSTLSGVSNSASFAYNTQLIWNSEYHYLADVRIYDEPLSKKELHDISLGLVCHYPLNDSNFKSDSIIYDTSGFGNHGTVKGPANLSVVEDAPRYDGAYKLASGAACCINTPNFPFQSIPNGTVSLWINRYSTTSDWRNYLFFANAYNWVATNNDFIIYGTTGNAGMVMDCCSNTVEVNYGLNKWNMYTLTWDLKTHTAKYYVNGSLVKTVTNSRIDTTYASAHGSCFVGNRDYTVSDYGISDFRMYATTLSDADIAQLYNTPITITSNGTMIVRGEVIEEVEDS